MNLFPSKSELLLGARARAEQRIKFREESSLSLSDIRAQDSSFFLYIFLVHRAQQQRNKLKTTIFFLFTADQQLTSTTWTNFIFLFFFFNFLNKILTFYHAQRYIQEKSLSARYLASIFLFQESHVLHRHQDFSSKRGRDWSSKNKTKKKADNERLFDVGESGVCVWVKLRIYMYI